MPKNLALGSVGSASKPEAPPPWWCRTPTLAVVIFAAILLNNERFIFHSAHYEMNDLAANSLQVFQAKHFHNVLGHYCRFGFYHPAPAFFYFYAVGEALFFDALHLVPTPFNAQFIALYALSAFFFSATLGVICRRLDTADRKWFLGLALLLAAWHFGAVGKFYGRQGLFDIWPPYVLALPFLCFLVAGASVASGGGKDLPLMTLAGCFLVHGYVCLPFFVVPLTLLAYGGLLQQGRTTRSERVSWPWQAFPCQHWLAGAIIGLFLVPIVIDVITAERSNIRLILDHIWTDYGERKGLLRSILYFLHFGAYAPYARSNFIPAFETFDAQGTLLFFRTHWRVYGLWLITIIVPIILIKNAALFCRRAAHAENDHLTATDVKAFLLRMYVILGAAILLTIAWGHFLEGPMFYYISTFNFAIYYGFSLIFAITAALWIEHLGLASSTSYCGNWRKWLKIVGPITIALATAAAFVHQAHRFRSPSPNQDQQRVFATTIDRALKMDSIQPKLLSFEGPAWAEAVGVALYLQRAGCSWYVADYAPSIPLIFGRDRAIPDKETGARVPNASIWRIVSSTSASLLEKEQGLTVLRLANGRRFGHKA